MTYHSYHFLLFRKIPLTYDIDDDSAARHFEASFAAEQYRRLIGDMSELLADF